MSRLGNIGARLYRGDVGYDFIGKRKFWYAVSILLTITASGRNHRHLAGTPGETFLDGVDQRGMRAELQPDIHAKIGQGAHSRGK